MSEYRFYGAESANIQDSSGLSPMDYYDFLSRIWCAETCAPRLRNKWSPDNKTMGQCSVTAFLMQDIFGGEVSGYFVPGGIIIASMWLETVFLILQASSSVMRSWITLLFRHTMGLWQENRRTWKPSGERLILRSLQR